jgi:hypothetical protein
VTMGDDGVSKLLSVKLEQAKEFAKWSFKHFNNLLVC